MREVVAEQLERLYRRIEFNDGFELDIIAPKTWLAEWHARFELAQRLGVGDGFELLELRLGPEDDVLEPGRRLADAVQANVGHRVFLVHVCDDGLATERWQPFFRRLNEIRNAIIRDFRGNLVLLLAPRLVTEFAAEAPDIWSVGAVLVVGTWTREVLLETMLDYVPALHRIAREPVSARAELTMNQDWRPALSHHSRPERTKQLLELMLVNHADAAARINVPAEIPWHIADFRLVGVPYTSKARPIFALSYSSGASIVQGVVGEPYRIDERHVTDLDFLLTQSLLPSAPFDRHPFGYAWIVSDSISILDPRLAAARRCFNLIWVPHTMRHWSVLPGTRVDAPVVACPTGIINFEVTLHRRGRGSVSFRLDSCFAEPPAQLWLPCVDPGDLGTAPLYETAVGNQ